MTFPAMTFGETGTFVYMIREVVGSGPFTYDTAVYTATVTITKNKNYEAKVVYEGGDIPIFRNLTIPKSRQTELTIVKKWDAPAGVAIPSSATVQLLRDGAVYGEAILLSESNTWSHTWKNLDSGYSWTVKEINVPDGFVPKGSQSGQTITIVNTYDPDATTNPATARVTLTADKTLDGGAPGNNPFMFTLTDANGNVLQTVGSANDGKIAFGSHLHQRGNIPLYNVGTWQTDDNGKWVFIPSGSHPQTGSTVGDTRRGATRVIPLTMLGTVLFTMGYIVRRKHGKGERE